ncbi:uncharacterized protein LOC119359080 [Triticum dicoccoides]|uniref:uncharacterized protein LOC119359080 n=1 Tax=Triticum dicoccoides TaxID=85692 RepID=UPI000E7A9EEF|nr:uncharacterized protein LOC119359080 [Triticum dicoccoides]
MRRRFINLVMKDYAVDGSYWLSRMRPQENLFYASTAEAMTAQAQQARKDKINAMLPFGSTLKLPPPAARFKSSCTDCLTLDFMPFYGRDSPSEGRIVALDSTGHTVLYDADADPCSVEALPRVNSSNWRTPISLYVTGANANAAARDSGGSDVLYGINMFNSSDFEVLVHCNPSDSKFGRIDGAKAWHWLKLPSAPYLDNPGQDHTIHSYTLLEDGKTICFSSLPDNGFGTYYFDTSGHEWTKAGRWALPFIGRAWHVPELGNLWFGFSGSNPNNICAIDLCSLDGPPKVLHEWRGSNTPRNWMLVNSTMVYLGGNRFCVVRFFGVYNGPPDRNDEPTDTVSIITGLEIVKGQTSETVLRMVKHKSRTYVFEGCGIECVF